ncbi:hypothetical protein AB0C11_20505 [Streptomyces sp. NPDC039016]|uniref:hypothetical protein n=1 Tax=Streptomyces sp. NPDC039016 TaxID=3154330 RepID=UPI003408AB51
MPHTPGEREPLTLGAKLMHLLRRRRDRDGFLPSTREVTAATVPPGHRKPTVSHNTFSSLMNGSSNNPTSATLVALSRALDAPSAFLMPGQEWDDLTALTVYQELPEAREALRLMQGLESQEIVEIINQLREARRQRGLAEDVPPIPPPPPGVDQPREGRPRRRLSLNEAAQRAADDLEGH